MNATKQAAVIASLLIAGAACGGSDAQDSLSQEDVPAQETPAEVAPMTTEDMDEPMHAEREPLPSLPGDVTEGTFLSPDGDEVGTVQLTDTPQGLLVRVDVEGVGHGMHGIHLHETGLCEPEEGFTTAGGHANPTSAEHGYLAEAGSHAGDLPNSYAHMDGHIRTDLFKEGVALADFRDDDGFAVMIHSGADDYESQPSGDAGSRAACAAFPTE